MLFLHLWYFFFHSKSLLMFGRLNRQYECWEENPTISLVLVKGSRKTLCFGADVLTLYHWINEGN
ncbi:hypothetical protein Bca101_010203 [Brassica carinata]